MKSDGSKKQPTATRMGLLPGKSPGLGFVLVLLLMLGGCGSDDSFPGSSNNQDPDALVTDIPLFYIERPLRDDAMNPGSIEADDLKDPLTFHGSAKLYMKVRAEQSAATVDLGARAIAGNVDIRDLDVAPDGTKILFSLRGPQIEDADEEDQPTWNIWEYDIENDALRRVISDNNQAEKGHDITPRYLADGRIIFASTRQQKSRSILQDEGKDQFSHLVARGNQQAALNLHVMSADGTALKQVTFNQGHDFYPVVMNDGKVVFSRWENFNNDAVTLYEMNPDGTDTHILYGHHSQASGTNASELRFIRSNVMPDNSLFVLARADESTTYGGDFIRIDTDHYIDNTVATDTSSGSGPAQSTVTSKNIHTDGTISPGGYFSAFFPLWDGTNRAVASWGMCQVIIGANTLPCTDANLANNSARPAPPKYGIWTYNYNDNTQIPIIVAKSGIVYTDVALGAARSNPTLIYDDDGLTGVGNGKVSFNTFVDMIDAANEEAIIHIRSVYDMDGVFADLTSSAVLNYSALSDPTITEATDRPARFLRVIKTVSEPPRDLKNPANGSYGRSTAQGMKEIIGYAPIEPDGSVKVRVPANVALMLSVVDANGKRLSTTQRHQNWITLRPGEVMECKGCHTRTSTAPHGRYDAQAASINQGLAPGGLYPGSVDGLISPFAYATMAEAKVAAAADISSAAESDMMELSTDLLYNSAWTDANDLPNAGTGYRYEDLPVGLVSPASANCSPWNGRCRIVINYEDHIMPIWELDRGALAVPIPATGHDNLAATCTRCHSPAYMAANADVNGNPTTQLDLTDNPTEASGIQKSSYVDLFVQDVAKVVDGTLVDCTQQEQVFDANGDPVLDINDNPTFQTVTCDASEGPYMSVNGARSSNAFFSVFEGGGSHVGYLTPAELKLIAEWLDIGAQYYNNHFDAPDN